MSDAFEINKERAGEFRFQPKPGPMTSSDIEGPLR